MTMCEVWTADGHGGVGRVARVGRVGSTARRDVAARPSPARELGLLLVLYVGYSLARLVGDSDVTSATANARGLLTVERWIGIDVEAWANSALQTWTLLSVLASYWYAVLHYAVTPAVLLWAYRRGGPAYARARNALVLASTLGLVGFTALPMAPPRMLSGFTDTLAYTSGYGWWGADASAPKGLGSLTNELAAMPSLHVGWAVWCAWVVLGLTRSRTARALALAYPTLTVAVVVATANHYVLDAVAGAAVVAVAIRLTAIRRPSAVRRPARLG